MLHHGKEATLAKPSPNGSVNCMRVFPRKRKFKEPSVEGPSQAHHQQSSSGRGSPHLRPSLGMSHLIDTAPSQSRPRMSAKLAFGEENLRSTLGPYAATEEKANNIYCRGPGRFGRRGPNPGSSWIPTSPLHNPWAQLFGELGRATNLFTLALSHYTPSPIQQRGVNSPRSGNLATKLHPTYTEHCRSRRI